MRSLLVLLVAVAAQDAQAQFVARPHLDWRTVETAHFVVHYPAQYRDWSLAVAERLESTRLAVADIVGFVPERRTQVLVDDPVNAPNGFALPFVGQPTMVFFPVPPTPRQSIGNSRDWGELLAVHEFAHLAHLARGARVRRDPWRLLPVHLGPVARGAPRWAIEGFATFVEGRVTGSGRPHNAQRAAVLRQWAIEGRLPTYGQLSGSSAYNGGAFAYLGGSAFLEWLAARDGDSTLTHLWRRMTAATKRSFPQAFAGLYGRAPGDLYGRFAAEVTRDALAVEARIDSLGGPVAGALVQRLAWETGDPALSPDGARVAVVLRSATRPGRVVVWNAGEDTVPPRVAAARAAAAARARARDPLDVPDRRLDPPPKRVVAELAARDGRAFDSPRFMPDGRHLLVTRAEPIGGGAFRPDLHLWDSRTGRVRRITRGAGIRTPDPEPGGSSAVGVQCMRGWCDVVRIDLASGGVTRLREGSPAVSYFRPRASADGRWIAVAEQREGRWRIVLLDARDPSRSSPVRDPNGADRFDVSWADSGRTLLAVSEAGGIANLERIRIDSGSAETLTRVTGAAYAPEASMATGEVWFLALHSRGLDVRRIPAGAAPVTLPVFGRRLFPVIPTRPDTVPPPLALQSGLVERPYDLGPRATRWLPGISVDAGARSVQLLLVNGDPVGRLELALLGAVGTPRAWQGARAWATVRRWRPAFTAEVFHARQRNVGDAAADASQAAIDAGLRGASLRTSGRVDRSAWSGGVAAGVAAMQVHGAAASPGGGTRQVGWGSLEVRARKRLAGTELAALGTIHGDAGRHGEAPVSHVAGSATVRIDAPLLPPVQLSAVHARDASSASAAPFERVAVGGAPSVLLDPALLPHRLAMPVLPPGALIGTTASVARADASIGVVTPYIWAARLGRGAGAAWHRVLGIEARLGTAAIPLVTLPQVELVGGAGYSIDPPFRRRTAVYASIAYHP